MVTMQELIDFLESVAPPELAESYDNVGLLIGDKNKQIHTVLVTMDADEAVAQEAKEIGADLVLSHHPLIFSPIKRLTGEDGTSRTIALLVKNDISLYSMHTNFDSVKSGLGDLFLDKIAETANPIPLEGEHEHGIGRIADMKHPVSLEALLCHIKDAFSMETVRYVGDLNRQIRRIAVVNGGGAEYITAAKEQSADCFISGDVKYHHGRFAFENDIAMVEIPHYNAEIIFCDYLKKILAKQFGDRITVFVTDKNIDIWNEMH